jgi:DNA polymerase-3 subunit delta'
MVMPALSGKHIQQNKISVDKIRELIYQFALKPIEADRRVAIIQNLEVAGRQATDALLKTLEEPPGNAVFIITTDNLSDLPETILSRCVHFALKPLASAIVKRELISRWGTNDEEASFLSRVSGGRLGWAVMLKQDKEALIDRSTKISGMVALLPKSKVDRFSYVEGLHKDRVQVVSTLVMWQSWWRDVMILASGANNSAISNIDYHNEIQKVASQVDVAKAATTISAIRNTLEALRKNANAKLALEVLMLQIPTVHLDS